MCECGSQRVSEKYCLGFISLTNPKHEKTQAAGISSKHTRREVAKDSHARASSEREDTRRERQRQRNNEHDVLFLFLLRNS